MTCISPHAQLNLSIDITWQYDGIDHHEHYFADQMNCWRDVFPGSVLGHALTQEEDQPVTVTPAPGEVIPGYQSGRVHRLPLHRFRGDAMGGPAVGRFYPKGCLSGLPGIFRDNVQPFRVTDLDDETLTADLNHPLSAHRFSLTLTRHAAFEKAAERGGSCTDWLDLALTGPGMQAKNSGPPTDYLSGRGFERRNTDPDPLFYRTDRLVHHIDDTARQHLAHLYGRLLPSGSRILDLMAAWRSHLPKSLSPVSVQGLGLNENELKDNPDLTGYTVHDLNRSPELPYGDEVFDAVICSLSVEYLTDPVAVMKSVRRVLVPGGVFVIAFSNRWFPEKTIRVWEKLHEFERMGMVIGYLRSAGGFDRLSTYSIRGYPRPEDDRYFRHLRQSDPVYAVAGRKHG